MTYPIEDEPPCIHHRSQFDTIPAPPPSRAGWTSIQPPSFVVQPDGAYVTRINAPVREPEFAAPAYIRKPSEPTMLSSMAYTLPAEPVFHLTRAGKEKLAAAGVDLSKPVTLSFDGGEVELPKPARADLVLSAQQWATAIRESLVDRGIWRSSDPVNGALDRLDAILRELADAEK